MKKNLLLGSLLLCLFSTAIIIFQLSCSQQAPAQTSSCIGAQPKFQFKANGNLYVCDAVFDSRLGWVGNFQSRYNVAPNLEGITGIYSLSGAVRNSSGLTSLIFMFSSTNPPSFGTYNGSSSDCCFSFDSVNTYNRGSQIINFTRISNGTADGTFSGTVQKGMPTPTQTINITEGVFSNIPVFN